MYHCHFEDVEHVTMGMHGIVFVKPDPTDRVIAGGHAQKAYGVRDGDALGETGYDREFAIMLSEIDTRAHFGDAHIQATDWTDFHADFWTMNGRAYPDTLEPNGIRDNTGQFFARTDNGLIADPTSANPNQVKANIQTIPDIEADESRLFSNPLSSLVQCAPGERVLIRFANLGFLNHTIVFPGLEVDVLGRDARYVPTSAQRKSTDSIQVGPGESRDVFFKAPDTENTYPFYDRGLSHYTGSADGTDSWVGGQRSEVRVIANLAPQLKPNGWGGEAAWDGEFPELAVHIGPTIHATGHTTAGGKFLDGNVTVDANNPGTYLTDLWYVHRGAVPDLPGTGTPSSRLWIARPFVNGQPNTFNFRVSTSSSSTTSIYWMVARDSAGVIGAPVRITTI
jgi:plastocyanin